MAVMATNTRGEDTVLARIDDRHLELALLRVALDGLREVQRARLRDLDRLRLEEIVVSVLVPGRTHFHTAVPDHGGGLHFLDDGRVGRPREQEEQAGVAECGLILGQQDLGGFVLGVRVGNVEPHAAGAGGADLQVHLGRVLGGLSLIHI